MWSTLFGTLFKISWRGHQGTYKGQECPFCETDLPIQQLVQETQLAPDVTEADLYQRIVVSAPADFEQRAEKG